MWNLKIRSEIQNPCEIQSEVQNPCEIQWVLKSHTLRCMVADPLLVTVIRNYMHVPCILAAATIQDNFTRCLPSPHKLPHFFLSPPMHTFTSPCFSSPLPPPLLPLPSLTGTPNHPRVHVHSVSPDYKHPHTPHQRGANTTGDEGVCTAKWEISGVWVCEGGDICT